MTNEDRDSRAGGVSLAVVNARIWTGDARRPWADGLAVGGDRLDLVGSSAEVRKLATRGTRVLDAKGAFVAPGFVDSHVHFLAGGFRLGSVQLRDARTPAEFVARLAAFAREVPAGGWITGGDWDHEQWGGELPGRDWIDAVTPNHPVWVSRLDGHMALANSAALHAAGVDGHTEVPDGGVIVLNDSGQPSGILKDAAMTLVLRAIPEPGATQEDAALAAAMRHVARHGVTSVHHMGTWGDLDVFRRAHAAHALTTRIRAAVPIETAERLQATIADQGPGDSWLNIGALKVFVDGSLGSHTAAFLEPYTDAPDDSGLLIHEPDALYELCRTGEAAGLQLIVHAIGDRAARLQLDVFERLQHEFGARDRRWRIEHAQHVAAADRARFGELGVIASVQPLHLVDDGSWAERVVGAERMAESYSFRSLRDAGARLAFGSDWFVAEPVPLAGMGAAVTRMVPGAVAPGYRSAHAHPAADGRSSGFVWSEGERLTVEEALVATTRDAAYAGFAESRTGRLVRGMLADFVILDADPLDAEPERIAELEVRMTVVGGRVVHEASLQVDG